MGAGASTPACKWKQGTPDELPLYAPEQTHFVTQADSRRPIPLAKSGVAAEKPRTIIDVFNAAVTRHPSNIALQVERGDPKVWKKWTWGEYHRDCSRFAAAAMSCGVEMFDSVSVIGFNAPEWSIACVGAILCGAKAAGIYTTNGPEACLYIADHCKSKIVVVENQKHLDKFMEVRDRMPCLTTIVMWSGELPPGASNDRCKVMMWDDFLALAEKTSPEQLEERQKGIVPEMCASLIYTSGTTGNPKAVMLSHDNIVFTCRSVFYGVFKGYGEQEETTVSYLPLSHVAAQVCDIWLPIVATGTLDAPHTNVVWFARPDALKGSLLGTLVAARPTAFFGVPRVWEKFHEAMLAKGRSSTGFKKSVAVWAKGVGLAAEASEQIGGTGILPWGYSIASMLVFGKVRAALGLDRCRLCFSGAAPISRETLDFFASLRIQVLELYGMSENTGPGTTTYPDHRSVGTVGVSSPGCEVKIVHEPSRDKPNEGEVCMRGRHIFMGYLFDPEKTQQAIDPEGWLHSGDVGRVDENGNLYITGRIKELIITAGGENIAPVPIEDVIKGKAMGVSQCIMIGDKRKFCSLLVTLKTKPTADGDQFTDELTGDAVDVSPAETVKEAQKDPAWQRNIQAAIDYHNEKAVSRAQRIQKFAILSSDFSLGRNELTPTLKLKRRVIYEHFAADIEAMYS